MKILLKLPDGLNKWLNNKTKELDVPKTKLIVKMLEYFMNKGVTAHENQHSTK